MSNQRRAEQEVGLGDLWRAKEPLLALEGWHSISSVRDFSRDVVEVATRRNPRLVSIRHLRES